MTTDNPNMFDAVHEVVLGALGAMRVIGIGTVSSYNPKTQTASIVSALKFCYYNEEEERLEQYTPGAISNIPVLHPSAGGFFSAMPVNGGDQGVILTADRALDSWKDSGRAEGNETVDGRRFNFNDSLFLPCGRAIANALSADSVDIANEHWVWGEDSPQGVKFKLGKGKFEFGTPLVSFLEQLTNAITNASKTASFAGSSVVTTLLGTMPLSNAGQLASQAIQLAKIQVLINSIRGTLT